MSEPITHAITPVTHNLGGFKVRRVLPGKQRTMVGGTDLGFYKFAVPAPGASLTSPSLAGGRVVLLGGEAFTIPRYVWWNFVSSSRERINQAKHDWREGRFGQVPGDGEEFILLPQVPTTESYP